MSLNVDKVAPTEKDPVADATTSFTDAVQLIVAILVITDRTRSTSDSSRSSCSGVRNH